MKTYKIPTYLEAARDAGLLRQYLAAHYGQVLTFGGSSASYWRGMRVARRVARLAGLPLAEVLDTAKSDAEILYA